MRTCFCLRSDWSIVNARLSSLVSRGILAAIVLTGLCGQGQAQDFVTRPGTVTMPDDMCGVTAPAPCFKRIAQDEAGLARSIFHIKRSSLPVILGVAAATGLALHYDKPMSQTLMSLPIHPTQVAKATDIVGVYTPFAVSGLMYFTGSIQHNAHARETGILATEAMVDAALIGKALKFVVNRQTPGHFAQSQEFYAEGVPRGASMPSSHALNAWAFARVVAGEYHSKWVSIVAYGLASGVSYSRAATGAHSVSDVIVGSALGYGIGEYVLRRRSTERPGMLERYLRRGDVASALERGDSLRPKEPVVSGTIVQSTLAENGDDSPWFELEYRSDQPMLSTEFSIPNGDSITDNRSRAQPASREKRTE
ncbi:MAG: Membrane-associated phospholipid phosphatase [Acidobacteriaceae bacterium]|nr:Membrane-associated phospholipid phosphatase [Acidobacteriaceae bacterium]